ncbi:MAG: ThuA domain-containing protein [Pirellulales bacterium]
MVTRFARLAGDTVRRAARALAVVATIAAVLCASASHAAEAKPKKIVFLAGTVHQGPGGHPPGTHEYELSARLLKHSLETATNVAPVVAEIHLDGWPRDERTLDDADTIVVLSDGADRNPQEHPLLVGERLAVLKKQMDRGCGLVAIHWTVFVPQQRGGPEFLEWIGGYFDYQSGPAPRNWFSKIQSATTTCRPAAPDHPICRGLAPFSLREEYYYNIRFAEGDARRVPILATPIPGEAAEQTVAWARERANDGRGFGFTGGHFFDNWSVEPFRRMVLNAIVWTAHAEVPPGGVQTAPAVREEATPEALGEPIQCLIVTGHQHPAHNWRETTAALQEALALDKRLQVTVVTDPEFLADQKLFGYDVVLLNYCNWQRGGLSEQAQQNFVKYLTDGGGLVLVHFSNGAFHASLPETPATDWPEYRNICRRVWDHAAGRSSHDAYGRFRVEIVQEHPITAGLNSFETIDELYCNQAGEQPIEVLAVARSTVTGKDEPMAFVYDYGRGRVFQTVLGHAAESIRAPGEAALILRGTIWAAGRPQRPFAAPPAEQQSQAAPPKLMTEGKFGAALDPRAGAARAARLPSYDARPLTVECWAKVFSKTGFNVLVANNSKESGDHWEIYTYAGAGDFSLYLPGCEPAEIRSGVDIADGQWHHVAAVCDDLRAKLYVDGRLVKDSPLVRNRRGGPPESLYFGGYPPQQIGCDGVVDEVRISSGLRAIDGPPAGPLEADAQTVGLWRFDRLERGQVEDLSAAGNPVAAGANRLDFGPLATRWAGQNDLQVVSLDTSPDESFLSLRGDTQGRLFVGGREALFVYEPDDQGGYRPRELLYRFPPDSWITAIEIRGDDLYVITNAALYLVPRGRVERSGLVPQRLIWGPPVDLHVTYHGLAWGPEGDLYFCSGDPLLNFGDFQKRPDHWGHWTVYTQPAGTKVPYTGVGGFFRCRADGSQFRVVAGGTRGTDGLAFDRHWNLFSDDNDHESLADRYSPARLLHVAPGANFFWPRGWIASMSPERTDLLEVANAGLGREAPVDVAYYDDPLLGEKYRHSLLVACWGQRKVAGFSLAPRGASFQAREFSFLAGAENARPVGVTVARGGRVFAAISYMPGNEGSPKYPSELVMITRADDLPSHPFEAYDAPRADAERLWAELSHTSTWRRQQAHTEILRRGGPLLSEAIARLKAASPDDPAAHHLPWLAAASGRDEARSALLDLASNSDASLRATVVRALAELGGPEVPREFFVRTLSDPDAAVRHAAVTALAERGGPLPETLLTGAATSDDTYLRQAGALAIARHATRAELDALLKADDPRRRLAGVLAAGFRLTVPPAIGPLPERLPLRYESGNAHFTIDFADARVDLRQLGRVGSFTTAEKWKSLPHSDDERWLFDALVARLDDPDDKVALQAGYFLWLLDDARGNELVTVARRRTIVRMLSAAPAANVERAWRIGPFADEAGFETVHAPEHGPIDLAARVDAGGVALEWQSAEGRSGFELSPVEGKPGASSYLYFRLESFDRQRALVSIDTPAACKLWHNGRPTEMFDRAAVLELDAGSNDLLVRVQHPATAGHVAMRFQAAARVAAALPEKLGLATLAERLQQSGDAAGASIPPEFLRVDWAGAVAGGNIERGRRLFSADALGCAKCHAVAANQQGGGGPSLADAARRFTVSHLVESVLLPGKQVAPVFAATSIATDDGRSLSGLVVEENDAELVLLLPTSVRQTVAKSTIEARQLQTSSPMPTGLVKTPAELGDILAYLLSSNPAP